MNTEILFYRIVILILLVVIYRLIRTRKPKLKKVNAPPYTNYKNNPWYPTGWTWNDDKKLWEPPDYLAKESKERWEWDDEKYIWRDKTKE